MVRVLRDFVDKYDCTISYREGDCLPWDDEERIKAGVELGLVEVIVEPEKPKKKRK